MDESNVSLLIENAQYEVIMSQQAEIESLKKQVMHLESLLFSRAIILNLESSDEQTHRE